MAEQLKQHRQFGLPPFASKGGNADRRHILEGVKRIREGVDDKPRNFGFGGVELVIPELDMAVIKRRFPETNSPDAGIRHRAWLKFLNSPESEPYRVHRRKHGIQLCRSITAR